MWGWGGVGWRSGSLRNLLGTLFFSGTPDTYSSQAPPPNQVGGQKTKLPHEGASAPRRRDSGLQRRSPRKCWTVLCARVAPDQALLGLSKAQCHLRAQASDCAWSRSGCTGSSLLQRLLAASRAPPNCWCKSGGRFLNISPFTVCAPPTCRACPRRQPAHA